MCRLKRGPPFSQLAVLSPGQSWKSPQIHSTCRHVAWTGHIAPTMDSVRNIKLMTKSFWLCLNYMTWKTFVTLIQLFDPMACWLKFSKDACMYYYMPHLLTWFPSEESQASKLKRSCSASHSHILAKSDSWNRTIKCATKYTCHSPITATMNLAVVS